MFPTEFLALLCATAQQRYCLWEACVSNLPFVLPTWDIYLRATEALQSCREKLECFHQDPLNVCVSGIGNFRNSIVFAKLSEGATLSRLKEIVGTSLQ